VGREAGLVFFISGLVILVAGYALVMSRRASRRYMVYRVVPMAGFFGALGLGILANPAGDPVTQALIAAGQTAVILLLLHVFIGRHLRG
jgi:hypothetical protein